MYNSFGSWKRLIPTARFRLVHLVILIILCISFTWILSTLWLPEEGNIASVEPQLRANILQLSLDYVRLLARAQKHTPDGPYHADGTNYDMKKTMAVLLNDMHQRITKLEAELQARTDQSDNTQDQPGSTAVLSRTQRRLHTIRMQPDSAVYAGPVDFIALLQGVQEGCVVNSRKMLSFPECQTKLEWLRKGWRSDPCYSRFGVDGTDCSFIRYLSEVESFCPAIEDRVKFSNKPLAQVNYDLAGLLTRLHAEPGHKSSQQFMRDRITRMWPQWVEGIRRYAEWNELTDTTNASTHTATAAFPPSSASSSAPDSIDQSTPVSFGQPHFHNRAQLKIHLHLSFISLISSTGFERSIGRGGPLGELVQWTDLLTGLYILGHDVTVSVEPHVLFKHLHFDQKHKTACQAEQNVFDVIFTDIIGYRRLVNSGVRIPKCKYRLLDSFGTEAQFNRDRKNTSWGGLQLNLKQFYTMFPHSPDNTFLGFVIENTANISSFHPDCFVRTVTGNPIALVYGKEAYMWQNAYPYLLVLSEFFEVHANVRDAALDKKFHFVHMHNCSYGAEFTALMRSAKIFVGLGFPYEGPAPLEAIANGVIFLNPHFKDPHWRNNTKFFADKPTSRKLTSQHPYMEQYVGEPYSYLVDMEDPDQIRRTVKRILEHPPIAPYTPFEYTTTGFIERLNALLSRQSFCTAPERLGLLRTPGELTSASSTHYLDLEANVVQWPPLTANMVRFVRGSPNASCVETCRSLQTDSRNRATDSKYLQRRAQYVIYPIQPEPYHCAPEHFTTVNHYTLFESLPSDPVHCDHIRSEANTAAPYWDASNHTCVLQSERLLFDCTAEPPHPGASRLCPCLVTLPGQSSLCAHCV